MATLMNWHKKIRSSCIDRLRRGLHASYTPSIQGHTTITLEYIFLNPRKFFPVVVVVIVLVVVAVVFTAV